MPCALSCGGGKAHKPARPRSLHNSRGAERRGENPKGTTPSNIVHEFQPESIFVDQFGLQKGIETLRLLLISYLNSRK